MSYERGHNPKKVCVLGSINLDIVASVKNLPLPGETVIARNLAQFPGGKGSNQAVAAARLGADTLMIGATGNDEPGARMRAFLQERGVSTALVKVDAEHPTGQALINVSERGENAIVIATGANSALLPSDISTEELSSCGVFLAQLETPVETVKAFFSYASAQHGTTILNAAPAEPEGAALFPLVDVLIVNELELTAFAGLPEPPQQPAAVVHAARQLMSRDGQTVIVTLGANGVVVVDDEQHSLIPSRPANVVDTTGAGDCFCGVFAAALAAKPALNEAVELAVTAASISVERAGAATSIPTRAEIEAVLNSS